MGDMFLLLTVWEINMMYKANRKHTDIWHKQHRWTEQRNSASGEGE